MAGNLYILFRVFIKFVPALFEYPIHHVIVVSLVARSSFTGIVQSFVARPFGQVQYPKARLVRLLRMLFFIQDLYDIFFTMDPILLAQSMNLSEFHSLMNRWCEGICSFSHAHVPQVFPPYKKSLPDYWRI